MRLREIRRKRPDIPERFIFYLQEKNYLNPRKVKRGTRFWSDYSSEDFQKIIRLWEYRQQDFLLSDAHDMLQRMLPKPLNGFPYPKEDEESIERRSHIKDEFLGSPAVQEVIEMIGDLALRPEERRIIEHIVTVMVKELREAFKKREET